MNAQTLAALTLLALAVAAVLRGWEVRLVLFVAALAIGAVAGTMPAVVREFLGTFADERFVVPIGSAMGFAYVLRHTGCDTQMVRLLVTPLKAVGGLLIPGVVLAGFVVNIPLVSQASAAVCLGAIVVPLLRGAGYSPATVGSTLVLGVSIGGELLNPGAPELLTVQSKVGGSTRDLIPHVAAVVGTVLAAAVVSFTLLTLWHERRAAGVAAPAPVAGASPFLTAPADPNAPALTGWTPRQVVQALVPGVPLAILFLTGPPTQVLEIPAEWLVPPSPTAAPAPRQATRLIGLAMLVGVACAALVSPRKALGCLKAFFEGAGTGFAQIVSLIITAQCLGKAVREAGLAAVFVQWLGADPWRIWPLAAAAPAGFAVVSGSGIAATGSLYEFFYPPAVAAGLDPRDVGAVVCAASAAGRTMSPVAAVVLLCAALSGSTPRAILARVAGPLVLGLAVAVAVKLATR